METDAQFLRRMETTFVRSFRDLPTAADAQRMERIEKEQRLNRFYEALRPKPDTEE